MYLLLFKKISISDLIIADEPENNDIEWLKENLEPPEDIISKWSKTYEHRLEWNIQTIEVYFNSFPCLKGPEGYELVFILNNLNTPY